MYAWFYGNKSCKMIKWIMIIIVAESYIIHTSLETRCDIQAYYWRDYYGDMPSDALKVGMDGHRKKIYIGQIPISNWLSPGKIEFSSPVAYVEFLNEEYGSYINIKVLCTQHPNYFEWIKTSCINITKIKDKHLVIGGFTTKTAYIGRVIVNGEFLLVGRVTYSSNINDCILVVTYNKQVYVHNDFDILAYNPVIKN